LAEEKGESVAPLIKKRKRGEGTVKGKSNCKNAGGKKQKD
jgi:hypothetical protein